MKKVDANDQSIEEFENLTNFLQKPVQSNRIIRDKTLFLYRNIEYKQGDVRKEDSSMMNDDATRSSRTIFLYVQIVTLK